MYIWYSADYFFERPSNYTHGMVPWVGFNYSDVPGSGSWTTLNCYEPKLLVVQLTLNESTTK